MPSIKVYLILCFLALIICGDKFLNLDNLIIKLSENSDEEEGEFADLLNGILGTELEKTIILSHCSNPYIPQPNSHETFKNNFAQLIFNVNTFLKSKTYKQITGEVCEYNLGDKNIFTSAKSAKITTKSFFSQVLIKSIVAKSVFEFLDCVGKSELDSITDPDYADELVFMISKEERVNLLFESFCSVNNIFNFLKNPFNFTDKNLFRIIGETFKLILDAVKTHYEYIKSRS